MKNSFYDLLIFAEPKPAKHRWTRVVYHILLAVGCSLFTIQAVAQERSWPENILQKSFDIHTQAQIDAPLDKVYQGCPRRDCIPSIDAPDFVSAAEARNMEDEDLILGLVGADTLVLTGNRQMNYDNKQPYGDYDESKRLMFPANLSAATILHPKKVVYGLRLDKDAVAVTERLLASGKEIKTETGGVTLTWRRETDGGVVARRSDNGENLLPHRMFWFAWYSFNTDTALRDIDQGDRLTR